MGIDPSTAFVSYSREDSEFALRLAKDLKAKGSKVWMDKLDLRPGQRWEREVETALNNCSRMLVILSPASVGSSNVLAEAAFAIEEGKEIIPVLYLECKVPFRLRPFQHADFRTSYDEGLQELLATLGSDRPAAVTAAATPVVTTTPAAPLAERERNAAEDNLSGDWTTSWDSVLRGRRHDAKLVIPRGHGRDFTASMTVTYVRDNQPTVVQETLTGTVRGKNVVLTGLSYTFVQQGSARTYALDTFELTVPDQNATMKGTAVLKHGKRPVVFSRTADIDKDS